MQGRIQDLKINIIHERLLIIALNNTQIRKTVCLSLETLLILRKIKKINMYILKIIENVKALKRNGLLLANISSQENISLKFIIFIDLVL
jgi:hypothetical protein